MKHTPEVHKTVSSLDPIIFMIGYYFVFRPPKTHLLRTCVYRFWLLKEFNSSPSKTYADVNIPVRNLIFKFIHRMDTSDNTSFKTPLQLKQYKVHLRFVEVLVR